MQDDLTTGQDISSYDPPAISIADLNKATDDENQLDEAKLKDIADSKKTDDKKSDEPKGESKDDQKTEGTGTKGDADDSKAEGKGDKDGAAGKKEGDPDSDDDKYKLDPKVAEAFPEQAKRYEEQRQGLLKREKQIGEHEEDLKTYDVLKTWREALESGNHHVPCLKDLMAGVAEMHGTDIKTLALNVLKQAGVDLGAIAPQNAPAAEDKSGDPNAWIKAGFDSPDDYALHQKTMAAMREEISATFKTEIADLRKQIETQFGPALKTSQEQAEAKAFNESVDKALPSVQQYLNKNAAEFPATKEQLAKAMKEAPGLAPERAFDAIFANEIRAHVAKKQAENYGQGDTPRDMTSSKGSQARKTPKSPDEVTIKDLNAQLPD